MRSPLQRYLGLLLDPFFRWWWALITGIATLLSYVLTPESGVQIGPPVVLAITLGVFTLLFFSLTTLVQGWRLYQERHADLLVRSIQRNKDLGGDWIFVLDGNPNLTPGTLLDIHRRSGDVEAPFAFVEIRSTTATGKYLATPVWISPRHIGDYNAGKFTVTDMVVLSHLQHGRVREVINATA